MSRFYTESRGRNQIFMDSKILCTSQIITKNPVLAATAGCRATYLEHLNNLVYNCTDSRSAYLTAELEAYQRILSGPETADPTPSLNANEYYWLIFDLFHILEYDPRKYDANAFDILQAVLSVTPKRCWNTLCAITTALDRQDLDQIHALKKRKALCKTQDYVQAVETNLRFLKAEPFRIFVTATMSAGKSTLINALTGKHICRSQNMACTRKNHHIINKAFEDSYCAVYDHDLVMTAGDQELMNNNEENRSDHIYIGAHFAGELQSLRLEFIDSPGINFCGHEEHSKAVDAMISNQHFDMLIYVINATETGTDDDRAHLAYVRKHIGRQPMIFVLNKIDEIHIDTEQESIEEIIAHET